MPAPRKAVSVAEASGAFVKNPQRTRKEPKAAPVGKPPKRLTEIEREAWEELVDELPWLARSDRKVLEVAAKLTARMMTGPEMGVNALAQLRLCLSSMGATPADRSKVSARDEEDDDPAAAYLQ